MGLKFSVVSDLHLEFAPIALPGGADVLLLSGDIVPAAYLETIRTDKHARRIRGWLDKFAEESLSKYPKVFHIMGNHEHYHGLWEQTHEIFREYWADKSPNVTFLEKEHAQIADDVRIWGGTLWTDFRRNDAMIMNCARLGMNDYSLIQTFKAPEQASMYARSYFRRIQPEMIYHDHLAALASLKEAVEAHPSAHWVVMSHHGPTYKSIDQRFGNDPLNYCYASDLSEFILDHPQINVWTHGHTHTSHMYVCGETMVLCNPRGYANLRLEPENETFNPGLTFEVHYEEKNKTSNEEANTPGT